MGRIEYEYPLFKVYYSNNSNNSNIRGNPGRGQGEGGRGLGVGVSWRLLGPARAPGGRGGPLHPPGSRAGELRLGVPQVVLPGPGPAPPPAYQALLAGGV